MNTTPLTASVFYQLFLRPFTPEGTLKSAERMLPHLQSMGVDVVYLCPINEADPDTNRANWSRRMKTCGFVNPKNPYRIKDYYRIDPEYGTSEDLMDFVRAAHSLDMKVMLDVVFRHSGPTCPLIWQHPDFYQRNEDGSLVSPEYGFPCFDTENPAVRRYFAENLAYYVTRFGIDGFRVDCGGEMPVSYWQELIAHVRAIRPDVIFHNEGYSRAHLEQADFDMDYGVTWSDMLRKIRKGEACARDLVQVFTDCAAHLPKGKYAWRGLENHDFCNDAWEDRVEKALGAELMACGLVINFTGDGIPYLYCGNEIADSHRHSILANRYTAPNLRIDWSNALTLQGQARMALVRKLSALRHGHSALTGGSIDYFAHESEEAVLAYARGDEHESLVVAVNLTEAAQTITLPAAPVQSLLECGAQWTDASLCLAPYGFLVAQI